MNELKTIVARGDDKEVETLSRGRVRVKPTVHLQLIGNDDDPITFPLCGELDPAARGRANLNRVTCTDCLEIMKALIENCDSYDEAAALIGGMVTPPPAPDPKVMEETFGGSPTIAAAAEIVKHEYLQRKQLDDPGDFVANIIGSSPITFYKNLIELRLIHGPQADPELVGEPNSETMQQLSDRLRTVSNRRAGDGQ